MSECFNLATIDEARWRELEERGVDAKLLAAARQRLDGRSARTLRAYHTDWLRFSAWCEAIGVAPKPPDDKIVGAYLVACAIGHSSIGGKALAVATIERRLAAISRKFEVGGFALQKTRRLLDVLHGIRTGQFNKSVPPSWVHDAAARTEVFELPKIKRFTKKRIEKILDLKAKTKAARSVSAAEDAEPPTNLTKLLGL
jgi:hypothetical protein